MIKYKNDPKDHQFLKVLRQRVKQHFQQNQIAKTANKQAIVKALLLLMAYLVVFIALFFSKDLVWLYLAYGSCGILTIFVALNIAHDAAHFTFFKQKQYNNWLLYTFDFLGGSGYIWQLKHVYSHHPHVNIPNMDGDIKQSNLVRIFPNAPYLSFHRYQHWYMPVLYSFYTLIWLLFRDFKDFFDTDISGKPNIQHPKSEYIRLFLGKSFFLGRMVILPTLLLPFTFWQVLLGFLIFHFCASYTVALALISAHVGEHSVYPQPDAQGNMEFSWVRHQIITTCDFATQNWLISHLFGGFNHHIVHHLFPNICHIHYPALTEILVKTCQEYGMPYQENKTLGKAVRSHWRFLKKRSKNEEELMWLSLD